MQIQSAGIASLLLTQVWRNGTCGGQEYQVNALMISFLSTMAFSIYGTMLTTFGRTLHGAGSLSLPEDKR